MSHYQFELLEQARSLRQERDEQLAVVGTGLSTKKYVLWSFALFALLAVLLVVIPT